MGFLWVLFGVAAIAGWYFMRKDSRAMSIALRDQSTKYNGVLTKPFGSYPQLALRRHDTDFVASAMHGHNGPFTYVYGTTDSLAEDCCFKITSRSMPTHVMEMSRELRKIKTGWPRFDQAFVTRCKVEALIRSLLTPEIQEQLHKLDGGRGLEVRVLKTEPKNANGSQPTYRFDLSVERLLTDAQEYAALIETAIIIYAEVKSFGAQ
jgi:hypothetical protein